MKPIIVPKKNKRKSTIPMHINKITAPFRRAFLAKKKNQLTLLINNYCRDFLLKLIFFLNKTFVDKSSVIGEFHGKIYMCNLLGSKEFKSNCYASKNLVQDLLDKWIEEQMETYLNRLRGTKSYARKFKLKIFGILSESWVKTLHHAYSSAYESLSSDEWPIKDKLDSKYPFKPNPDV